MTPLNNQNIQPEIQPFTPKESFPDEKNWRDLSGFILKLTEEPSYMPRGAFEQIAVVTTGGSSRFYIYDTGVRAWKSTTIA